MAVQVTYGARRTTIRIFCIVFGRAPTAGDSFDDRHTTMRLNCIHTCRQLILGVALAAFTSPTLLAAPWISDQDDGTYKNPVLFADYSDPDLIRIGGDFYMTASSFNC